jgi:hypothetical protein
LSEKPAGEDKVQSAGSIEVFSSQWTLFEDERDAAGWHDLELLTPCKHDSCQSNCQLSIKPKPSSLLFARKFSYTKRPNPKNTK